MNKLFFLFSASLVCLLPLRVLGAGVVINEVMFDPIGSDTGLESVEIFNSNADAVDLSGWQIYPDGIGYFTFAQQFMLEPKSFVVIHLRASGADSKTDLHHSSPTANMGNTSGSVALFSGEPRGKDTIQSFVSWGKAGETWETAAADAGLWAKGVFIDLSGFSQGNAIALAEDGNVSAFQNSWRVASSTPGALNNSSAETSVPPPSSGSSSVSFSGSGVSEEPSVRAFAGDDATVVVGSAFDFAGRAIGRAGEPLDTARFWWNFGDGETKEGRIVSHVFRIPGTYLVGLHVSSGSNAASDYATVTVVPNQIKIASVVEGIDGSIRLFNESRYALDIGGWIFADASGKQFAVPEKTKISAQTEIGFANVVTGLLLNSPAMPLTVAYANGTRAFEYSLQNREQEKSVPASPVFVSSGQRLSAKIPEALPENDASSSVSNPRSDAIGETAAVAGSRPGAAFFFLAALLVSSIAAVCFFLLRRRA